MPTPTIPPTARPILRTPIEWYAVDTAEPDIPHGGRVLLAAVPSPAAGALWAEAFAGRPAVVLPGTYDKRGRRVVLDRVRPEDWLVLAWALYPEGPTAP